MKPSHLAVVVSRDESSGQIVLDASHRIDSPRFIVGSLRAELEKLSRDDKGEWKEIPYGNIAIRAQANVLALLRLMRWDVVFNFQEPTGLPWPKETRYHWKRAWPAPRRWSPPPED